MLLITLIIREKACVFCFDREFTVSLKEGALKRQCRAVSLFYYNDVTVIEKVQKRPMTSQCLSLKNVVPCLVITQVFSCLLIFLTFGLKRTKSGATLPSTRTPRPPRTPTPTRPLWTEEGLASKWCFVWILWRMPACDFQQNYAFCFWCLDPVQGQEQPTFEGKPFNICTLRFSNPLSGLSSDTYYVVLHFI